MKRVLLVQRSLQPPGGGQAIGAWMIEALKREYRVTLLTWTPVDPTAINRYYGTALQPSDFATLSVPSAVRYATNRAPLSLALFKKSVLLRACKQIGDHYDLLIATDGEADFGRPGIQYVNYPWRFRRTVGDGPRWYDRAVMARAYRRLCGRIGTFSTERMRRNLTLTNSEWTAGRIKERHGIDSLIVHPPVLNVFPSVPWEQREDGFVCIGRISPVKKLEDIIRIVASVRAQGHNVHLHIIGTPGPPHYTRYIHRFVRDNAAWVFVEENLSRAELARLVAGHRYGIHAMPEEHFGIAVAEMVHAGCIVFVPRGGGQLEIVGDEQRLLYTTEAEAAVKIVDVLRDLSLQDELRAHLATRQELFSTARFMNRIREIARSF